MIKLLGEKYKFLLRKISKIAVELNVYRLPFLWNIQYKRGVWGSLQQGRRYKLVRLVESLAKEGRIVELCCGEGALICELNPAVYSSYLGSDISKQAIRVARQRAEFLGLDKCVFETLDMMKWTGEKDITLVILEECIYYLPMNQQKKLLKVACESLALGGNIVVTFHSGQKHKETIEECSSFVSPARRIDDDNSVYLVIEKI